MPSDFASNSLRRIASAPGARSVVQRLRNDQDEMRLATVDATDRLSDEHGRHRPEVTHDGVHPHDIGRAEIRAAVAELRPGI